MPNGDYKEKRWAIIVKPWGGMSVWHCDENGHLRQTDWFVRENTCLIPTIMDVAPPEETPDGVKHKRKGLYLLVHEDSGPDNAGVNAIATQMTSGWVTQTVYGYAVLMDAEAEGKPIGLPWDEAAYIIEQWRGNDGQVH